MKILLSSYWPLPFAGGIWTYVSVLKQGLEGMGHHVEIFTCHPDEQQYYLLTDGRRLKKQQVRQLILPHVRRFCRQTLPQADALVHRLESERYGFEAAAAYFGLEEYDLIHAQDVISARALARVKPKHTPLVTTIHGSLPNEFLLHGSVRNQDSFSWQYLLTQEHVGATSGDLSIVPSNWMRRMLTDEFDVPPDRLNVIPYGLDTAAFAACVEGETNIRPPDRKKVIACAARLDKVKGHTYLLQALAFLKEQRNDWICWLIGDGHLRKMLEQETIRLGLQDHVLLLGNRDDVPALLKLADLFVLPSLQDNHPFAVMEAQLAGCPVISTRVGGIPEMIDHEKTGLLTEPADCQALHLAIARALEDNTLCRTLSQTAMLRCRERWSAERMIRATGQVYETVLARAEEATVAARASGEGTSE